ncbi:MAG TPA: mating pair formation protein [Deltaproteobacteria bacterium]|nr:MAG: hypothetical protein A2048_08725 [Deltaproteobacteria bacterium GWA2_45_12]HBF13536.1 mating pair formation protein [Deltaproteobacteria bacterium]
MKTKLITLTLLFFGTFNQSWASIDPKALSTDPRLKQAIYSPNQIYNIRSSYGYGTTIEFSPSETVETIVPGDSIAWQVVPSRNRIFVKPVEQNPDSNLTIVTNKNIYFFDMGATTPKLSTYLLRFEYVKNFTYLEEKSAKSPADYNFRYKITNNKKSGFVRAFDNSQFTYIQFKDLADLPAIFWIDSNGKESVVNYRIDGAYVVVERVADRFVFRKGKVVGTLINKNPLSKRK